MISEEPPEAAAGLAHETTAMDPAKVVIAKTSIGRCRTMRTLTYIGPVVHRPDRDVVVAQSALGHAVARKEDALRMR